MNLLRRPLPVNSIRTVFCAEDYIKEVMQGALEGNGTCIVGLSGGKTPKTVYEKLSIRCEVLGVRSWKKVRFFLVDERYVPASHPESNQRLVRETLLKNMPIPEENLVFPNTALPIDACIADYGRRLKELWEDRFPDLIILGMGTDGHVASLFPPLTDSALGSEHIVLATRAPEGIGPPSAHDRITLSLNALCSAEHRLLLLGPEKKQTWETMMASTEGERQWPLKRIIATGGLAVAERAATA